MTKIKWNATWCPLEHRRCFQVPDCAPRKAIVKRDESIITCTHFDVVVGVEVAEKKKKEKQ